MQQRQLPRQAEVLAVVVAAALSPSAVAQPVALQLLPLTPAAEAQPVALQLLPLPPAAEAQAQVS